jgi:hypothetical protein
MSAPFNLEDALKRLTDRRPDFAAVIGFLCEADATLEQLVVAHEGDRFGYAGDPVYGKLVLIRASGRTRVTAGWHAWEHLDQLQPPTAEDVADLRATWLAIIAPRATPTLDDALKSARADRQLLRSSLDEVPW